MAGHREKFQELLREMFQFDCSDLDFGIYRIMNFKRDAVEQFIQKDLLDAVTKELSTGVLASQSRTADELNDVADKIRETMGDAALDGEGALAEQFHGTPLGKRYLDLQARASGAATRPALEAAIFNHLYAFFSRYYDAGDFLSKRRYSRKEKYAIPYNGEEVHLHWANSDQYYVKTGEYFTDYRFKAPNGVTVHFRLQQADVPQNNVKGDKRLFIPLPEGPRFDAQAREVVIPFEYRPLNEAEQTKYGQRNQQDAVLAEAIETLPARLTKQDAALAALIATHHRASDGTEVSFLAHHLRQYTQRNTSDFFIHKDLKGFLARELDFYLKNEVLNLDEMGAGGETRAQGWFQIMRVMKAVGGRIIDFLAQIEDFQKKLFEKKKFITDTQYCITLGNIAEEFYAEIAACEAQWAEWKELFHIDEEEKTLFNNGAKSRPDRRVAFLKAHPTLVLDTKHFDPDFRDRLIATFDDLDAMIDGLLVHSENLQALNLLLQKYREKVNCIFIDPPYNTGVDGFPYKDTYQHSSWLAMMRDRLLLAKHHLSTTGLIFISIDFVEVSRLRLLCDSIFGSPNFLADIAWEKRYTRSNNAKRFYSLKDTILSYRASEAVATLRERRSEKSRENYSNPDNDSRGPWISSSYVNPATRTERRNLVYQIRNPFTDKLVQHPTHAWKYDIETHEQHVAENRLYWGNSGEYEYPRLKTFLSEASEGMVPVDVWPYEETGTTDDGGNIVKSLFGREVFDNPKPPRLIQRCFQLAAAGDSPLYCDFFAGSGTTAHAVIDLNREDGGRRRFVQVEAEHCFDAVLLPRIKKVTFSADWKEGKPIRQATEEEAQRSPRIVKYIRLESYEDSLNNITLTDAPKTLYDFDDYMLRYMLQWETKESATLLNIEQLARPFSYKLQIAQGQETQEKVVDIPETFAYLLGMHVTTRRVYSDKDRRYLVYRGRIDHREIAAIWRDTAGWDKTDYERDKKFVADRKLAEGADEVFVNGDSLIPKARTLDSVFKSRMFGGL